jgi:hypothetical protein
LKDPLCFTVPARCRLAIGGFYLAATAPKSCNGSITAALEARVLGTAITLAGCTLPEGQDGQAMVRLRAARCLTRLAAGLMAMNAAGSAPSGVVPTTPGGATGGTAGGTAGTAGS